MSLLSLGRFADCWRAKRSNGALSTAYFMLTVVGGLACQPGFAPPWTPEVVKDVLQEGGRAAAQPALSIEQGTGQEQLPRAVAAVIAGQLTADAKLAKKIAPGDTVYVMARAVDNKHIVAVSKLTVPAHRPWPMAFLLQDDRLEESMQVLLSARIDKDGDATTKQLGDCMAERKVAVTAPSVDVVLHFDHIL